MALAGGLGMGVVSACSLGEDANSGSLDAVDAEQARIETWPVDGASAFPIGAWPELRIEPEAAAQAIDALDLVCAGEARPSRSHRLTGGRIAVQPERRLPNDADCRLAWSRAGRRESIGFRTFRPSEAPGRALFVVYRRGNPGELAPIPDDYWTRPDLASPTRLRLELPVALRGDVGEVVSGLRGELSRADGWSPVGPIMLSLSDRIDPTSIPRTAADSLDPLATIALVDVDPKSPGRGLRWPFETVVRTDRTAIGLEDHALWVIPARPLRPGGRYALFLRRGIRTKVGRSMSEPAQLRAVLTRTTAIPPGPPAILEKQLAPALAVAESALAIPWTRDDLVFALSFTVRSLDDIESDPRALAADVRALAGPRVEILRIEPSDDPSRPLAALVHGRFAIPVWRERRARAVARDDAGRPRMVGRDALRFVLALPRRAEREAAPLLVYQHGNPGSAREEIGNRRQDAYLEAGFAVIGFTDLWNRGKAPADLDRRQVVIRQVTALANSVRKDGVVPDDWLVTLGEQLALLEALPELAALDLLPATAPDGRHEIDAKAPLVYEGISQGAIHGQALIAYDERVRAASLVVGGARLAELALHQAATAMVKALPFLFGDFRPIDLWTTIALFQTAIDRQDAHVHALRQAQRFARSPAPPRRASVLLTAGLADGYVPNRASRSLAYVLGPLPWLDAPEGEAAFLPRASTPLRGNLPGGETGAYLEVVPYGSTRPTAPGCLPEALPLPEDLLREGHFCAQLADESVRRRVRFLRSAVDDAPPVVIDPFADRRE